jgi:hypothetical protein
VTELRAEITLSDELVEAIVTLATDRVLTELRRDQERRWLPVGEAAAELGLSQGALRKHIARGNVRADRIGSRILVDMTAIGPP